MTRNVTVLDVQALAETQSRLTAVQIAQTFGISTRRAGGLLALAARGHSTNAPTPMSNLAKQLMQEHRFSATEARAAQSMINNGDIQHG